MLARIELKLVEALVGEPEDRHSLPLIFVRFRFGSTLLPSSSGPIEFFFTLHWEERKKKGSSFVTL